MLPVHEENDQRWQYLLYNGIDGLEELITRAKADAGGLALLSCFILRQDSAQARGAPAVGRSRLSLLSEIERD